MTEEQHAVLHFLRQSRKLRRRIKEFHYRGNEDFLLRHGQWYEVKPWTYRYDKGIPKNCFANSMFMGVEYGLRYVEGYAISPAIAGFPIHHGWNIDSEGKVIDSTWLNTGLCYFGVEFSIGRVDDAMWNGDSSVLDDWERKHPLLRQPWTGEDFSIEWEPSVGMKMYKRMLKEKNRNRTQRMR